MKVMVVNLSGVKLNKDGSCRHYVKAGSRWPMTIGFNKSADYYPFPFWLSYTSALLKRDTRAEVRGLDGVVNDMTEEDFFEAMLEQRPNLLITEIVFLTIKEDFNLLRRIKGEIKCKIAICGNYPTVYPKEILEQNDFLDYVFLGEYEETAKELVVSLMEERFLESIPGLAVRGERGVVINERRPLISDLDSLPYPDRTDFPATRYYDFTLYSPCISMMASRGCPGGCIFCTERHIMYNSPRYRKRSPGAVVNEMEFCVSEFKAKQLYFDDMSFTVDKKYVQEICDEVLKKELKIPWTCMGDAMFIDRPTLVCMKAAGCVGIKFGIESANPEILSRIGKPLDLKKAKDVVSWGKELGIMTHATYCLGLPGETVETIKNTLRFMDELNADTSQVSKVVPYPGTPLYQWAQDNNCLSTYDSECYDGTGRAILNYAGLSNKDLDIWFNRFLKKVSRKKIRHYLLKPRQSFSIISGLCRQKGFLGAWGAVKTFLGRAL